MPFRNQVGQFLSGVFFHVFAILCLTISIYQSLISLRSNCHSLAKCAEADPAALEAGPRLEEIHWWLPILRAFSLKSLGRWCRKRKRGNAQQVFSGRDRPNSGPAVEKSGQACTENRSRLSIHVAARFRADVRRRELAKYLPTKDANERCQRKMLARDSR